ncbi:MAG: T9SS type A sorting domain-containing protein [Agriterribacter sp.]
MQHEVHYFYNFIAIAKLFALAQSIGDNNNINLQFDNIKRGAYTIELVNNAGQVIYRKLIQLAEGSSIRRVDINNNITSGIYQVRITGRDMRKVIKIFKQ